MMLLDKARLNRLISQTALVGLSGFSCAAMQWRFGHGLITASSLICLMATLGTFTHYEVEPGVWMLAALFGAIFGLIQGFMAYAQLRDAINGNVMPWPLALDFAIATRFWWLQLRVLGSVFVYNRRVGS